MLRDDFLVDLKRRLSYDPETGVFTRLSTDSFRPLVGKPAGSSKHRSGYVYIEVDKRKYAAHRLAWLFVYGNWPSADLDHKNRIRSDNRIDNLRETTDATNNQNRRKHPGANRYKGVNYVPHTRKWAVNVKKRYFGLYENEDEANEVAILIRAMIMPFSEEAELLPVFYGVNRPDGFRTAN